MAKKSLARCQNDACRMPSLGSWSNGSFIPSGHITAGSQISFLNLPGRGMAAIVQCTFCRTEHVVYRDGRRDRLVIDLYQPTHLSVDANGNVVAAARSPQRTLVPVADRFEFEIPGEALGDAPGVSPGEDGETTPETAGKASTPED